MGQSPSHPHRERRRSLRVLKLPSLYPKSHKRSLSATFTVFDRDSTADLVNINTASEEQLMTLPGVTREIAHNIIEHRQAIGRFKRVDDLALVSGIGAEKLYKIRAEICVRDPISNNSAVSNSVSSLNSDRTQEVNYVDLNTASIFELQQVVGVTQELAANIIYYREKKGKFKSVDELRKVKGIDPILFSVLRSYFVVNLDSINENYASNNNITENGFCNFDKGSSVEKLSPVSGNSYQVNSKKYGQPLKTTSTVNNNNNHSPPLQDIFDLLSAYSHRPVVEEFNYIRNSKKAFRLATWNLYALSVDKAQNPGFLEVCCRTFLENRLSIIAIQEVENEAALDIICDELNNPKLRRVMEWQEKYHKKKYIYKNICYNHLGFIYISQNPSMKIEFLAYQDLEVNRADADVMVARWCIDSLLFLTLVNIKVYNYSGNLSKIVTNLLDSDNVVVLGDFTGFKKFEGVKLNPSVTVLPLNTETNSTKFENCLPFTDNIMLSSGVSKLYTGFGGIVREGLSHLAIPRGWTWGGVASEHCPVWCELYVQDITTNTITLVNHFTNHSVTRV